MKKTTSAFLALALLAGSVSWALAQAGGGGGGDAGNANGNTSAGRQDIPKTGDKDK